MRGGAGKGEHQKLFVLHFFQLVKRSEFVHQHARFAAARPCQHSDVSAVFVFNNLPLHGRECVEQLVITLASHVAAQDLALFFAEIAFQKGGIVHAEIIANQLQGSLKISFHQFGIFADDVDLLHARFVIKRQFFVIVVGILLLIAHLQAS